MNFWKLFSAELTAIKNHKGKLMAIIGVCLIPIIYVAILLSPTWGPYDNLSNLPVAFVNKDEGAVSDGNPINVGEELMATLKESNTLGWNFVSAEQAQKGLDAQEYYMIVEVPEDFSRNVTTVLDTNPVMPELRFIQNEGLSFMASQVTNSATERLREQLGDKITATYARTVFSKFGAIEEGFTAGAEGSNQIYEGSVALADGTTTLLSSLQEKAPDITKLAEGAKTADAGASQLLSAVQGGTSDINRLAAGSKQLSAGVSTLKGGTSNVLTGLTSLDSGSKQVLGGLTEVQTGSKQVLGGLSEVNTGSKQVLAGLQQSQQGASQVLVGIESAEAGATTLSTALETTVAPGAQAIAGGMKQVADAVAQLVPGAQGLAQGLAALAQQNPQLAASSQFQQLLQVSQAVSAGLTTVNGSLPTLQQGATNLSAGINEQLVPGAKGLTAGLTQLSDGQTALVGGMNQLVAGQSSAVAGLDQLVAGQTRAVGGIDQLVAGQTSVVGGVNQLLAGQKQIVAGVNNLQSGATQVANGNAKVATSWTTLNNGVASLKDGLTQISAGNETVAQGWGTLAEGATALKDGANRLKDGSAELQQGLSGGAEEVSAVKVTDANIAMFASPVKLVGEKENPYEFYRDSMAPYILSLALFVGMLVLSLFVEFKKPVTYPGSATSWFVSKWLKLAMFAAIQAIIMTVFVLVVLQLQVTNIPLLFVFSIFVSITFMSIIFFLVAVGNHAGRFVAVALIVAQLSITGSNLPIPMLPEGLRSLAAYLPLTYSNAGFKSIISIGDTSMLMSNVSVLGIFLVVSSLLTLVTFFTSYKMLQTNKEEAIV